MCIRDRLSEDLDSEKISDLIAYLKQQIAENHLDDPDKLADLVRQAAEEMGITPVSYTHLNRQNDSQEP